MTTEDFSVSVRQGKGNKKGIYQHQNPDGSWSETLPLPANLADQRHYGRKGFKFLRYHFDQPLSPAEREMETLRLKVKELEAMMEKANATTAAPVVAGKHTEQAGNFEPERAKRPHHRHS